MLLFYKISIEERNNNAFYSRYFVVMKLKIGCILEYQIFPQRGKETFRAKTVRVCYRLDCFFFFF